MDIGHGISLARWGGGGFSEQTCLSGVCLPGVCLPGVCVCLRAETAFS